MRGHGMTGNNAPSGASSNRTNTTLLHKTMNETSKMLSDLNQNKTTAEKENGKKIVVKPLRNTDNGDNKHKTQ